MYLRELIDLKLNIYKIGKSKQELKPCGKSKRCNGYPKGSIQLALYAVSDCDEAEKHLIHELKMKDSIVQCKKKYGVEYFCGPLCEILDIVNDTAKLYRINEVKSAETEIAVEEIVQKYTNENPLKCIYCFRISSTKSNSNKHDKICSEKDEYVRNLEIQLNIPAKKQLHDNGCRFCHKEFSKKCHCTRHLKICKIKQEYRIYLEAKLKEKTIFKQ